MQHIIYHRKWSNEPTTYTNTDQATQTYTMTMRFSSSKLPDEIKKLMIENPIVQPQMNGPVLSDDIINGAARLMNNNSSNKQIHTRRFRPTQVHLTVT